jgi:PD-(D/E)XK nuclease superfamily
VDWSPISASQLETWKLCERRWFFAYVLRRPRPPNRFAEFGLLFHPMAEAWLKSGAFPELKAFAPNSPGWKAAAALLRGIPHLPSPRTEGLVTEHRFEYEAFGIPWQGVVDYAAPSAEGFARCADVPLLGDHKTTGTTEWDEGPEDDFVTAMIREAFGVLNRGPDPRPNTPEKLRTNTQAMIYAHWLLTELGAGHVALNWVHFTRREPGAHPVREDDGTVPYVSLDQVHEHLEGVVVPRAEALISLRRKSDVLHPQDIEPNPASCFAFGGPCPHMAECGLWTRKVPANMSLKDIIGKKQAAAAAKPAPKAEAAKPGKPPPWRGAAVNPPQSEEDAQEEVQAPPPRTKKTAKAQKPVPEPETQGGAYSAEEVLEMVRAGLDELMQAEDQDVQDLVRGMCARVAFGK